LATRRLFCRSNARGIQEQAGWDIFLKTVGTDGVASASWHWTRVASLFQRIAYYFTGCRYLFRVADDFMMLSSNSTGVRFTLPILRFILLVGLCEIPLKWPKTRGGFESRICWLPLPL
jgi:hypothetical protein